MNLQAENLTFGYKKRQLFREVTAQLSPGKLHYLAGPNGSGKSTLLKVLCGYLKADSGVVRLNDMPLEKISGMERARCMGVLHQNIHCDLDFTLREMVLIASSGRFPRLKKLNRSDLAELEAMLERFELNSLSNALFRELSGGERQRALLAGVLLLQPQVMLLDEPTSALDPAWRNKCVKMLEEYALTHTVLAVTHDPELLGRAAGTLWLLDEKGVFYSGKASEMLNSELFSKVYNTPATVETAPGKRARIYFD